MPTNLDLYELQQRAELLRRDIFCDLTRPDLKEQLERLDQLEAPLRECAAPPVSTVPAPRGVLIDNATERSTDNFLLGPDTTQVSVKVLLRMTHVPTGFVHLLNADTEPLVSFDLGVSQGREFARLRVTSYIEGYSARAVDTIELLSGQATTVKQLPTFFPERLRQVQEQTRAMLHIEIDDLGGTGKEDAPRTELHRSFPIWLLPPTTAWLEVRDPTSGQLVNTARYLAAWVTPNAPDILHLLRKAAGLVVPARSITGYQGSEAEVLAQVSALFQTLQKEGLAYVSTVFASGGSSDRLQQRVRLPREALASKSYNCIDATVLFASLLEAASLFAGIVILPKHALVAWKRSRDPAKKDWSFLETTMIGTSTFDLACTTGTQLATGPQSHLLSIPDLRLQGIVPME